jgi:hypothetical protein
MSLAGKTVRPSEAVVPNRPVAGQDGYLMRAIATATARNHEFVPPSTAKIRTARQHCGMLVVPSWSGSPAAPQGLFNQPAIGGLINLDVPKANRVAWFSSYFSLSAGNNGPWLYSGPVVNYRFAWEYEFQIVTNPNLLVVFGLVVGGQVPTKLGQVLMINGTNGSRARAIGHGTMTLVSGTTFWPGARPYNGTVAANALKMTRMSLRVTEAGTGAAET